MLATLLLAGQAHAAEQGGIGASSKGEIVISVRVAGRATMTDMSAEGAPGARGVCVWLDTATRGYALTMLGGGVRWRAPGAAVPAAATRPGATLSGLVSTAAQPDCDHDAARLAGYEAIGADPTIPATLLIAPE